MDVIEVLADTAALLDPPGDSSDLSVLCGLVGWAVANPDRYDGWSELTVREALRWTFGDDADFEEIARDLALWPAAATDH